MTAGRRQTQIWGMGIAEADVTGDTYYFITSMADNKLQTLSPWPAGRCRRPTSGYRLRPWRNGASADAWRRSASEHRLAYSSNVNNDGKPRPVHRQRATSI